MGVRPVWVRLPPRLQERRCNVLTEGKTLGGMSSKKPKGIRRPMSGPLPAKPRRRRQIRVVKSFKCSCGSRFSEKVKKDQTEAGCRFCKGIAEVYNTEHAPPIWKKIEKIIPECPRCGAEMGKIENPDTCTMFDLECWNCGHVY